MRLKTIRELPRIGRSVLPILQELIEDADPLVREAVVEAALKAGRDAAVGMLERQVAREKDRDVLFVMIRELRRVTSAKGLAILGSYLRHADEDLAIAAFATLAKMESKRSVSEMRAGLRDPRWRVRVASLQCVGTMKSPDLASDVESLLEDKDEFVRFTAVQTLAEVKGKQTVKRLEAVFLRDDNLKGPIIAAFAAMDVPLPESFRPALQGKPVPLLVSVAGNLRRCGGKGLAIASDLAAHADNDVACAALSMLAEHGADMPQYRAVLSAALRSKDRERVLTVLRGLRREESDSLRYGSSEQSIVFDEDTVVAGEGVAKTVGAVAEIINAFFGDAKSTPPAATNAEMPVLTEAQLPATAVVTNRGPSVDDVLSAFMGTTPAVTSANSAAEAVSSLPFVDAIRSRLKDSDQEIRFAASCALLARGDMSVISEVAGGFADRPEDERRQLANLVRSVSGKGETLPFVVTMLRDSSAEVRAAAVGAMLQTKKPDRIEALFQELMRPETRLKPTEVYTYDLRSGMGVSATRKMREWVLKLLEGGGPQWRVTLGLVLLPHAWQRGDEARLESFLSSKDPLVRRAAWYALGRKDPKTFSERIGVPAGDSSDMVRMVVPSVFRTSGTRWVQYFTEEEFDEDWAYDGGYSGFRRKIDESVVRVLREMESDVSARVRFEAMLALLDQGEDVPVERVVRTLEGFADIDRAANLLQSVLERGGRRIAPEDAQLLLAALERADVQERSLSWLRKKIKIEDGGAADEPLAFAARQVAPVTASASGVVTATEPGGATTVRLVYFVKAGCSECAEVSRHLANLRKEFPLLRVEEHDIEKSAGKRYNEALCRRFDVPDVRRLVAPAIFATAGALVKEEATYGRLGELVHRSSTMTDAGWAEVPAEALVEADAGIKQRWETMALTVVVGNGLADGVNPCAFATIIFLLSYLQVVRRAPRQILVIGLAFVVGVFVAYYGLGLGLAEIVKHSELVRRAGRGLNIVMAVIVAVLAVLNVRDGILCARGRMGEMFLQLPGGLKAAIHRVIRHQVRQTWMVLAAFVAGLVVSVLELACTGQVYLPTIYYILQQNPTAVRANAYLLVYNLAFIVPLCVVFGLAYSGVRSERVALWLEKHAAFVKFATAALFVAMLVLLVRQM
jgi:cytochrome c biogenesis protein CcdA/HEAT repeat protein